MPNAQAWATTVLGVGGTVVVTEGVVDVVVVG
jgi:hypothetical protein